MTQSGTMSPGDFKLFITLNKVDLYTQVQRVGKKGDLTRARLILTC